MGTISEKSATANDRITGIGVDTATCFVGTYAGYTQGQIAHDMVSSDLKGSIEGVSCSTGWGDGYYPVYQGAHLLDPTAVAFVEFLPPTVVTTHTDIDGDISWTDEIYSISQTHVRTEVIVNAPDGKLIIAGDPFHSCAEIETIDVEPGSYTIRVYDGTSDETEGQTVCVIIAPVG